MAHEKRWRLSINYGPEGETNYANVYDDKGQLVGNLRTHHASLIVAGMNAFRARNAPDGGVVASSEGSWRFTGEEEWRTGPPPKKSIHILEYRVDPPAPSASPETLVDRMPDEFFDQDHSDENPTVADRDGLASPASGVGVGVKPLNDDEILEIIKECFPWQSEAKMNDLLTYEKSVPLFPQATYDVPSYRAERFVRAIEQRIRSALVASPEQGEVVRELVDALREIKRNTAGVNAGNMADIRRLASAALAKIGANHDK